MGVLHLFFGFSGRINRSRFWLTVLVWFLIGIIAVPVILIAALAILGFNITNGELPDPHDTGKFVRMILDYAVLFIIILACYIAGLVSWFAVGVKRLHDRNKSGWWLLFFYAVPNILQGIGYWMGNEGLGAVVH